MSTFAKLLCRKHHEEQEEYHKAQTFQAITIPHTSTLTLIDLNEHTRLVIRVGGEDFGFLGCNSGITA